MKTPSAYRLARNASLAARSFAGALAALLAAHAAQAADFTWTQNTAATQTWTTAANWSGSAVDTAPGTTTDTLTFFADSTTALINGSNNITTSVPAALTMNLLTLNGKGAAATGAANVTLGSSAATWTLDGTNPTVALNGVNGSQALNYTAAIKLALAQANTTFSGNGTASFTFSGVISGAGNGMTKSGSSTLTLSGTNSFTGQLTVEQGVLKVGSVNNTGTSGVLGNSALAVILGKSATTGTLEYTGATSASSKRFTLAASGTGAIQVDTATTILSLSGALDGSGALNKTGAVKRAAQR